MTSDVPASQQSQAADATAGFGELVRLDNRSTPCAVGLIRAAEVMAGLRPGSLLEIWSKDRFAPYEIPVWAARDGHEIESQTRGGWWPFRYFVFRVRKPAA